MTSIILQFFEVSGIHILYIKLIPTKPIIMHHFRKKSCISFSELLYETYEIIFISGVFNYAILAFVYNSIFASV